MNIDKFDQIGLVVKNINDKIGELEKLGLGPFTTLELKDLEIKYRGTTRNISMKLAFTHIGDTQLELIEAEGECFYTEFLKNSGVGINHLGVYVKDLDNEVSGFINRGIQIIQEGEIMGVRWVYLDTIDIFGFVLELIEIS